MGKLTNVAIKNAKPKEKPYKLPDGHGLYVLVNPNGSKYWRHNYRYGDKHQTEALGVYPEVTLAEVRELHAESRRWLREGKNPQHVRSDLKAAQLRSSVQTFEAIGQEWEGHHLATKGKGYREKMKSMLKSEVYPYIGNRPIREVGAQHLLAVLKRIEDTGRVDTAHRVRSITGQVFRYAMATGRAESDPTPALKGALKARNVKHRPAITDPLAFGKLLLAIDAYEGTAVVCAALKLAPLVFLRPNELRHMEWSEVDLESARCDIDAGKMKLKRPHIVPLARQAVDVLLELQLLTGRGRYVFPSARAGGRPLSDNGMNTALVTMGVARDKHVPHGFRASARTMLDEQLRERKDIIEHQSARKVRDMMGDAYNRTDFLEERAAMMQRWADYLDDLRKAAASTNVIALKPAAAGTA
jgi:integrase